MVYGSCTSVSGSLQPILNYFISPLKINGSAIESIFSVLKFTAGGNLSASNYGSFRGRVITGREVITNSNSERGYRDDVILVSGSVTSSSEASRMSYSVRLIYDPFGLNEMKQFCFSANLSQSTIGGRLGSNACTIIASLVGYQFVKLVLPEPTLSILPVSGLKLLLTQWLRVMLFMTFFLMGRPETLTLKMPLRAAEMICTLLIMINPSGLICALEICHPLSSHCKTRAACHQRQVAVLISGCESVALLIWGDWGLCHC